MKVLKLKGKVIYIAWNKNPWITKMEIHLKYVKNFKQNIFAIVNNINE